MIQRVSAELRSPVRTAADFDARLMARIREEAGPPLPAAAQRPAAWRWLVRPRTVRVSPLAGLALAAGLAGLAVLARAADPAPSRADAVAVRDGAPAAGSPAAGAPIVPTAAGAGVAARRVRFTLAAAPGTRSVAVVGDFNDWDAAAGPLARGADGSWSAEVALPPGRYEYTFLVDGVRVVADSVAPLAEGDDFGVPNSVITVGGSAP